MLTPPATQLSPWLPGYWITQTGYALTQVDISNGVKDNQRFEDMTAAVKETKRIIQRVMANEYPRRG